MGAIAIVAILVLAVFLSGVVPGFRIPPTGGGSPGPTTEQSAASTAESYANGVSGGPWSLVETYGLTSTLGGSLPIANFENRSCPLQGSQITTITVPPDNASYSGGLAEMWIIFFSSPGSTETNLLVLVQNGAASDMGELSGPTCVHHTGPPLSPGLIDSPAAAQAVLATSNGTAFLASHSTSNVTYLLYQASVGPAYIPVWEVTYFGCSGDQYQEFDSEVNASSGAVTYTNLYPPSTSILCGAHFPLNSSLRLGNPTGGTCPLGGGIAPGDLQGCTAGDFSYTVRIDSAYIDMDNFELQVLTASGNPFSTTGSGSFCILNLTGDVVASYPVATDLLEMTAGWQAFASGTFGSTPIGPGQIVIDMGQTDPTSGEGLQLRAIGEGGFTGSTSLDLP